MVMKKKSTNKVPLSMASEVAPTVVYSAYHGTVMVLLYTCQGIAQGIAGTIPSLLAEHHVAASAAAGGEGGESILRPLGGLLALFGLPMYAFTFKCVWAPLIDHLFRAPRHAASKNGKGASQGWPLRLHHRAQWVVGMQFLLCFAMVALAIGILNCDGGEAELFRRTISHPHTATATTDSNGGWWWISQWLPSSAVCFLMICLTLLAYCSATQDIALDAWAVEGTENTAAAGQYQFVGLSIGSALCLGFTSLFGKVEDASWSVFDVPLRVGGDRLVVLPVTPLIFFLFVSAATCFTGALVGWLLSAKHPLPCPVSQNPAVEASPTTTSTSTSSSLLSTVKDTLRRASVPFLLVVVLGNTTASTDALIGLVSREQHVVDTVLLSRLRLLAMAIGMIVATWLAPLFIVDRSSSSPSSSSEEGRAEGDQETQKKMEKRGSNNIAATHLLAKIGLRPNSSIVTLWHCTEIRFVACLVYALLVLYALGTGGNIVWLLVAHSVVAAVFGTLKFISLSSHAGIESKSHPAYTASLLTLYNAGANIGFQLPNTITLYVDGLLQCTTNQRIAASLVLWVMTYIVWMYVGRRAVRSIAAGGTDLKRD